MWPGKYFKRQEFECKCGCGFATVDAELLEVLDQMRYDLGPIYISSACRCEEHNKKVGGVSNSKHLEGIAADCHAYQVTPEELYKYLIVKFPNSYGIGLYNTFVHIDIRQKKARWVG